jgi:hypothetical protein
VRSSSAVGIDGHQWNVQRAPKARLPCRALCECGWTSTAGQPTRVLLELKGHLEDTLEHGAGLSREGAGLEPLVERREARAAGPALALPRGKGGDHDDL